MIVRLLGASLRHRYRQLGLIAMAVLAAAGSAALIGAFSERLQRQVSADLAAFGPNLLVRPQPGGPPLPMAQVDAVRAVPGVIVAAGVHERDERDDRDDRDGRAGRDLASSAELLRLHPAWSVRGRWPGPGEVALGAAAVAPAGAVVVGTIATGERFDGLVFTALAADTGLDRIEVRAQASRLDEVARAIEARVPGAEAAPVARVRAGDARLAQRLRLLLLGIGGITLTLAALTVAAATAALLADRRAEVGLFLALGYPVGRVTGLLAGELIAVALAAGLLGELLGELGAAGLARRVLGAGDFTLTPSGGLAAGVAASIVVALAVLLTLRRVARLDAAAVLRGD